MQKTIRTFIAVPIPNAVAVFLQQVQSQLQLAAMDIRWVATQNIHLTLNFLGDIDPTRVPAVAAKLDSAAAAIAPFEIKASGVGVFPNLRHARVLWVGLAGEIEPLKALQATLDSSLDSVACKREPRDFRAHLTIGRTRRRMDAQTLGAALESMRAARSDSFRVDRLTLFQSKLKSAGAEYIPLHTSRLSDA